MAVTLPGAGTSVKTETIGSDQAQQISGAAAHDDTAAGSPLLMGGYASATAPSDVSANGDAVRAWLKRNGAQVAELSAAGALIGGDATNGLDVDVTRIPTAGYSSSATFTPGAAAHHAGDCIGAAQEFTGMGPSGGVITILGATLSIASSAALATAWRVHLYNVTPPSAIADNAVWDYATADLSAYLGYVDLPSTAADLGTNQWVEVNGLLKPVKLSGTSLFGYLQAFSAVTTAAVAHKVSLITGAI